MHKSVLKKEVLEYLAIDSNENFVDTTAGRGGHAISILENNKPKGRVLGIELTEKLYTRLLSLNINRLVLVNDSFINLEKIIEKNEFKPVSGILFDLGFSSWHIEESKKGFSFLRNEALDMRYNSKFTDLTADEIVNEWTKTDIKRILKKYGEERFAERISQNIVEKRKEEAIKTTFQLVEIVKQAVPVFYQRQRIHPATKTFQALRITVNDELKNLEKALPQALEILKKRGRIVVISFHSLEDRIVKNYFKNMSKKGLIKILTKKPIKPSKKEIINNPRSRSAKLRVAIRL